MDETIEKRLAHYIKAIGMTQFEFGQSIGLKKTTFSNKIQGVRTLDTATIVTILGTYPNLSAEWLLMGRGKMERPNIEQKEEMIEMLKKELEEKNALLRSAIDAIKK